jgi:hypothetical protein
VGAYVEEGAANGYRIRRLENESETDIDTAASGTGQKTLKLTVDGATQSLEVDSSEVCTGTDSVITSGTYAGIHIYDREGGRLDNWSAADLTSPNVTVPVSLLNAALSIFTPTISGAASVPVSMLNAEGSMFGASVSVDALATVNLITAEGSLFAVTTSGDGIVSVNTIQGRATPFAVTTFGGVTVSLNLIPGRATPYAVTVDIGGSVTVPVNVLYGRGQAQVVTVAYGATVAVSTITAEGSVFTPTVSYGATVPASLIVGRGTPFQVAVQTGGNITVPVNLVYGRGTPQDVTVSGDAVFGFGRRRRRGRPVTPHSGGFPVHPGGFRDRCHYNGPDRHPGDSVPGYRKRCRRSDSSR